MNRREFLSALKSGEVSGCYLLYGEERYLIEHALAQMCERVVGDDFPEINIARFDETSEPDNIIAATISYPMFSEKKLIIVRNFDFSGESGKKLLKTLCADIESFVIIAFVYSRPLKKGESFPKSVTQIKFDAVGRSDLIAWIKRRFSALSREISTENADFLVFRCGSSMQELIPEIEKVAAHAKRAEVSREDIIAVATVNMELIAFELANALTEKNYAKALKIAEKLEALNERVEKTIGSVSSQIRSIYKTKLIIQGGGGTSAVADEFGAYRGKILAREAEQVSLAWLRRAIELCLEADLAVKSMGDTDGITELLIARLAGIRND